MVSRNVIGRCSMEQLFLIELVCSLFEPIKNTSRIEKKTEKSWLSDTWNRHHELTVLGRIIYTVCCLIASFVVLAILLVVGPVFYTINSIVGLIVNLFYKWY